MHEPINNLTDFINAILKISKSKQIDTGHLYEILLKRSRIIISEMKSLVLTDTLTEMGIINTMLLDSRDINIIVNKHSTNATITCV